MSLKIYTKTGDKGDTGLFGGERVSKDSLRIEAYGTVDELNSSLGYAITEILNEDVKKILLKIQNYLFQIGSDLAAPDLESKNKFIVRLDGETISELEHQIDKFETKLPTLKNFILPGGAKSAALLHIARTVCRRAERRVVALKTQEIVNDNIVIFLNRLSDLLFVLTRIENMEAKIPDTPWQK